MEPFIYIKSLMAFGQVFAQQSSTERKGFVIGVSAGMAFTSILGNTPNISDGASISLPNLKIN